MPAEEQAVFAKKLAGDKELQTKTNEIRLLLLGVREAILEKKLDAFHAALPPRQQEEPANVKVPAARWLLAAAILLALFAGTWLFITLPSVNNQVYTRYYKPDPGLISAMSTSDNYAFDRAMIDYKTGAYEPAIAAWKTLLQSNNGNDTLLYFLGSAYLAKTNTNSAIYYFKTLQNRQSGFSKDADWYLGLALLKKGKYTEAAAYIRRSEHPKKEAILNRLKDLK